MKLAVKFSITLALVYSMVFLTACPSAASLQKAKDESSKLAGYANAGVDLTRTLYRSNVITLGQKDAIAQKFLILADGGIAFDTAVNSAIATYGTGAPQSVIDQTFATFDEDVITKFINILADLKLVSNKAAFAAVISTIETAVLLVSNVFGKKKAVALRLAAAK